MTHVWIQFFKSLNRLVLPHYHSPQSLSTILSINKMNDAQNLLSYWIFGNGQTSNPTVSVVFEIGKPVFMRLPVYFVLVRFLVHFVPVTKLMLNLRPLIAHL